MFFINLKMVEYCSIGHSCFSAQILKNLGLRNAAYPFDWVFTMSDSVVKILNDDFATFLDKNSYIPVNETRCGLKGFHERFFDHKNPFHNSKDYEYYQRCVARFRDVMRSDNPVHLLYYNQWDALPYKKAEAICDALDKFGAKNYKMIFIDCRPTENTTDDYPGTKIELVSDTARIYHFELDIPLNKCTETNFAILEKEFKEVLRIIDFIKI